MGSQLVSILIPVYNREEFISQTIYSALEQTYKNIEVIVVDNCSSDNTWKIIKTFLSIDKRVKAYRNDSNIGPVKNWLRCIQKAKGVYGKILWSDDLMSPQFIEESMNAITKFNDVGFVYSAVGYIDNDGNKIGYAYHLDGSEGIKKTSSFISRALLGDSDIPVSPGCALFRLKTLKKNLIVDIPNRVNADTNILAIGNDLLLFLLTCKDYDKYYYIQNVIIFFVYIKVLFLFLLKGESFPLFIQWGLRILFQFIQILMLGL